MALNNLHEKLAAPLCKIMVGLLAFAGSASSAFAYYTPLQITPAQPVAGQPIFFSVTTGHCDIIQAPPPILLPEWVIANGTIRATVRAIESQFLDFCIYPEQTFRYELPVLASGSFTLELYRREVSAGDVRLVQTTQFVVGAAPVAVPSNSWWGLGGLAVLLAALGVYFIRPHRVICPSTGSGRTGL